VTLLNKILHRKVNWIGHNLRINYLHDALEEQMAKVKSIRRKRMQFLQGLRNRRYWKIKKGPGGKRIKTFLNIKNNNNT